MFFPVGIQELCVFYWRFTEGRWSDRGHLMFFTPAGKAPLLHILSKYSELRAILCVCGQFYRQTVCGRQTEQREAECVMDCMQGCVFNQGWCVSAALSASVGAFLCEGLSTSCHWPVSQSGMGTLLSHIHCIPNSNIQAFCRLSIPVLQSKHPAELSFYLTQHTCR